MLPVPLSSSPVSWRLVVVATVNAEETGQEPRVGVGVGEGDEDGLGDGDGLGDELGDGDGVGVGDGCEFCCVFCM